MIKNLYRVFLLMLLILLAAACTTNIQVANQNPVGGSATNTPVPAPEAGKGTLYGNLIDSRTGKPFEANFYLAKNLTIDHPGYPPLVAFSYNEDPRAIQDTQGNFVFSNVTPGRYVLVMWTPDSTEYYIKTIDGVEQLVTIEVKEGQAIDLGELTYP